MGMVQLNAVLGAVVVTVGFGLAWGELSSWVAVAVASGVAVALAWASASVWAVWGWTTLLLGIESFAYPVSIMVRLRQVAEQPTNEQMGQILTAIVFGIFSSVFWLTFSYGIFKRLRKPAESQPSANDGQSTPPQADPKPKRKRR